MSKLIKSYCVSTMVSVCLFLFLYVCFSDLSSTLIEEDGFMENLTAMLYFCSFMLSIFGLMGFKYTKFSSKMYLGFSFLSLMFFLDEISFGHSMYQFKLPRLLGREMDGVHDIVGISKFWFSSFLLSVKMQVGLPLYSLLILLLKLSLYSLFFVFMILVIKNYKSISSKINNILQSFPSLIFLFVAVLCGLISVMMDDFLVPKFDLSFLMFLEELFEMNISLSFLFFSLGIKYDFVGRNNHTLKA